MKKLIIYFIVLLLAVWLGILMHGHPGYVLIGIANTRIETSFWLALFVLLLLLAVLYWLWQLMRGTYHIPGRFRAWGKRRHKAKLQHLTEQGIYQLLAGNWHKAELDLSKAAKQQPQGVLNYLGAAEAAQGQKNYARRDQYLEQARQVADKSQLLVITRAQVRWYIESAQWDAALQSLSSLQASSPRHPFLLKSLEQIYYAQQNWEQLHRLLPKLKQQHLFAEGEVVELEHKVYLALMVKARETNQPESLEQIWHTLPDYMRKEPKVLATYTEFLIEEGSQQKAESLLKSRLRRSLDPLLLQQYAKVVSENSARQLSRAEIWLTKNPDNAALLLCLGKLCMRHRLWGKARSYLEASNKRQPNAEVYIAQGEVLEHLGEKSAALESYRDGLKLISSD